MAYKAIAQAKKTDSKIAHSGSHNRKEAPIPILETPRNVIHSLQRTIGNQAVGRLYRTGILQARLKKGGPIKKYEQEADYVDDEEKNIPDNSFRRGGTFEEEEVKQKHLGERIKPLIQKSKRPNPLIQTIPADSTNSRLIQKSSSDVYNAEKLIADPKINFSSCMLQRYEINRIRLQLRNKLLPWVKVEWKNMMLRKTPDPTNLIDGLYRSDTPINGWAYLITLSSWENPGRLLHPKQDEFNILVWPSAPWLREIISRPRQILKSIVVKKQLIEAFKSYRAAGGKLPEVIGSSQSSEKFDAGNVRHWQYLKSKGRVYINKFIANVMKVVAPTVKNPKAIGVAAKLYFAYLSNQLRSAVPRFMLRRRKVMARFKKMGYIERSTLAFLAGTGDGAKKISGIALAGKYIQGLSSGHGTFMGRLRRVRKKIHAIVNPLLIKVLEVKLAKRLRFQKILKIKLGKRFGLKQKQWKWLKRLKEEIRRLQLILKKKRGVTR